jgi:hypothetical protein
MQGIVTSGRDESALDSRSRNNSNRRMDGIESKIEIFKPFGEAFELTKKILFQPFNFEKWLIIGFAAFLSNLSGGGYSFNFGRVFQGLDRRWWGWAHEGAVISDEISGWVILLIAAAGIIVLAIVLALMWVGSRGRFIFTDCVVRNRAAIVQPWNEYRREGNSLFLFSILVTVIFLALIAIGVLSIFLLMHNYSGPMPIGAFIDLVIVVPVFVILIIGWAFVRAIMAPTMYRQRCSAFQAFRTTLGIVGGHPVPLILYFLFSLVLGLAAALIAIVLTCATCCLVAIPYVGTVILLPLYVLLYGFMLLFLRQFGPDYDVWQAMAQPEMPIAPPQIPPSAPPLPP